MIIWVELLVMFIATQSHTLPNN